jgi:hypothetical protein
MRLLKGSDSRLLRLINWSRLGPRGRVAFPLVRAEWWAWEELNLRLHPYQQSRAYRCATLRFRRWCATVEGQVMRSYVPSPASARTDTAAAGQARGPIRRPQGDGAAGGRGSPIECVTVTVVRPPTRPAGSSGVVPNGTPDGPAGCRRSSPCESGCPARSGRSSCPGQGPARCRTAWWCR